MSSYFSKMVYSHELFIVQLVENYWIIITADSSNIFRQARKTVNKASKILCYGERTNYYKILDFFDYCKRENKLLLSNIIQTVLIMRHKYCPPTRPT